MRKRFGVIAEKRDCHEFAIRREIAMSLLLQFHRNFGY
jgi:hypothetical protein